MTRILVVGAGLIGHRHVKTVTDHPHCTLAGVVDPNPPPMDTDAPVFADLNGVDVPVDGVIIATPTQLHLAHTKFAAEKGWPVIIEKPVAATLAQADELVDIAKDIPTLMGHHRRHHASVQKLKTLIDGGAIGTPIAANVMWAMKKPDDYFDVAWRQTGADPIQMNLVHDLDLMQFVLGPVARAHVMAGNPVRGAIRPESGVVSLEFESGLFASITFADTTPTPWGFEAGTGENPTIGTTGQDMMFFMGTKGGVSFPSLQLWGGSDTWADPVSAVDESVGKTDALNAQLDHFLDMIHGRATSRNTAEEGRDLLYLLADIQRQLGMDVME